MKLSEAALKTISEWLESTLDLSNMNLTNDDLIDLCTFLQKNKNVKCLLLDHNQITSNGVKLLIKELPDIEHLSLSYNNIDDSCLLKLAASQYKSFNLSWNNITNNGVDILIKHSLQDRISVDSLFVTESKKQELRLKLSQRMSGVRLAADAGEQSFNNSNILAYYFNLCVNNLSWVVSRKESAPKVLPIASKAKVVL
jgi:hypothetical protein